jgi:arsenate reductase
MHTCMLGLLGLFINHLTMRKVLILCTGNSCRSQMADGLLSFFSIKTKVYSAGTKPEKVNPFAIKAMAQIGIDISKNTSNHVDEYTDIDFDYVFTVCDNAKEICPIYPKAKQMIHQSFPDPADATGTDKEQLLVYIQVRNQLSKYFKEFVIKNFH